jgi:hypothetical protein
MADDTKAGSLHGAPRGAVIRMHDAHRVLHSTPFLALQQPSRGGRVNAPMAKRGFGRAIVQEENRA